MTRRLLYALSGISAVILLMVASVQAAPLAPTFSLSSRLYSPFRMIQGSTTIYGNPSVLVFRAGTEDGVFSLSSTTLTMNPASGTVTAGSKQSVPFTLGWTDTTTIGPRTGIVTLTNDTDPSLVVNNEMDVYGAVVANRQLTVAPIGTSTTPLRIMVNTPISSSISTGSNPLVDGDNYATRINTVRARASVYDGDGMVASYTGTILPQFNAPNQSIGLNVVFSTTGNHNASYDLSKDLLKDGEDPAVGATLQAANLAYNVQVVEQRKLATVSNSLDFGNILKGASVSDDFVVDSLNANPDSLHTTSVTVANGGKSLGDLTVAGGTISAGGDVSLPISGTFSSSYGKVNIRGTLPVVTAEAAAVHDTKAYRSINVSYKANVGVAKLATHTNSYNMFDAATQLSAKVAAGSAMTNLSSEVDPKGTLAADPTPAISFASGSASFPDKSLYGAVGSEAVIATSSALPANSTVWMQWRKRTGEEAGDPTAKNGPTTLPAGKGYLASDVVQIGGVAADVIYALQMSFDDRICLAKNGPINGAVANEFPNLFIAQLDGPTMQWQNAVSGITPGSQAQAGVLESLSGFMAANSGVPLNDLVGSWGVDPATSSTGLGHSWAIVEGGGSGIFAVDPITVPEPASLVLLLTAGIGLFLYGWRRRK